MHTLILVGYWRSKMEPVWPDPAWFIDRTWNSSEAAAVVEHVQRGEPVAVAAGVDWCRFRCGREHLGSAMLSDGTYVWPQSLVHYMLAHAVRPPDEFVQHAGRADAVAAPTAERTRIATDWWRAQRGWSEGRSYLTPGFDGRLIAMHTAEAPISTEALLFLRGFPSTAQFSNTELIYLLQTSSTLVLSETCDHASYRAHRERAEAYGITLTFEEPDE